jgi:hypothetical protein
MAEDQASGPLSLERNESIFRNDILPDYLPDGIGWVGRPRLILLGGQPGAGKTAVLIASHAELDRSGPTIRIVGDDLRSYHPNFLAFQRQDPETASQFTQADAGRWTENLLAAATERKVNIVFETTMRTPENVARVIGMARNAGYEVEARAVAVNPRLSWQGNHVRFEEMLRLGDAARVPPQHIHDAAVDGLRVSLRKIESERLVDRVQLRTRGSTILYDNETRQGEWSYRPGARQALEAEQSRPMTRSELQRFADDWSYVLGRMEERRAPADRIAEVRTRAADDVNYLLTQRREADGEDARRKIGRNMALAERTAIATAVVDETGAPLRAMRDDLRLRTTDIANRAGAKVMMEAVLAQTAHHDRLGLEQSRAADAFVEPIAANERTLSLGRGVAPAQTAPLVPARHLPDMSEGEIGARLQNSAPLADKRAEIDNLARLVFGSSQAASSSVLNIRDARSGAAAGDDVREGRLGEMAGEGNVGSAPQARRAKRPKPTRRSSRRRWQITGMRSISSDTRSSCSIARNRPGRRWTYHVHLQNSQNCWQSRVRKRSAV